MRALRQVPPWSEQSIALTYPCEEACEAMTDEPWTCDTCGKPILDGQLIYTIANNEEKHTGRHAQCQDGLAQAAREGLDNSMKKLHSPIGRVQASLDRRKR